jgi:hypothetical protein
MSREKAIAGAILLSLAGCRAEPAAEAPVETVNVANDSAAPLPDADINASLGILGDAGMLDQRDGMERFIGRWAVNERLCDNAAWTFTATEMRTPMGTVCSFTDVGEARDGYDMAASCSAESADPRDDVIELRFAEATGGLLFDSENLGNAGLIRCEG